ncbi:MAG: host attachment protein [Caldimonas sp.]
MEGTIWFVLADADRARILEQWFARRIADRLEQAYAEARFEFLRFAAGPRFLDRLHAEIDKHPDLHRAELDWLAKDLMALEHDVAIRQMGSGARR